jgi:hypothetical protein
MSAMTTWAAKDLPARLLAAQVAKLLNCTSEDVAVLVTADKLRPLGRPNSNAVKFFSAVELISLLTGREWLDEATKTIGQFWKRKNANVRSHESNLNFSEWCYSFASPNQADSLWISYV